MIKEGWIRVLRAPLVGVVVTGLRARFGRQIAFVQARLSPIGAVGLHLTAGALVIIAACWLFGGIAEDVVTGDPLTIIDAQLAAWFEANATPNLTQVMLRVTRLHGAAGITVVSLVLASVFVWKRDRYWLAALALAVPGGMLLNVLTKHIFARSRPSFGDPLFALGSYSFPSGHVTAATLSYGLLAAFLMTIIKVWRPRVCVLLLVLLVITLVALSRLVLGAHYLSDVLAAFAQAVAWVALCVTALQTLRRRDEALRAGP